MFKLLSRGAQQVADYFTACHLCDIGVRAHHGVCQSCWQQLPWLKHKIERHQQDILIACHYEYPISQLIQQFKYEQQLHHLRLLSGLLLELKLPKVHAIVPMPISNDRLMERGFNQSLLIAKELSKVLNIPVWQPVQRLAQHSQKGLSRLERLENIEDQFVAKTHLQLIYRKVLIIDDVVTTGSSINALSQVLKQLGCQHIYSACLAAGGVKQANHDITA